MLSTAMAAMVNFLMRTLLWKDVVRMGAARLTRNLQLGQGAGSFEDVTLLNLYSVAIGNHSQQKGASAPGTEAPIHHPFKSVRRALRFLLEFVDQRLPDTACRVLVDRLHGLAHRLILLRSELDDLALAALPDLGERVLIFFLRLRIVEVGRFLHRFGQLVANVGRQI